MGPGPDVPMARARPAQAWVRRVCPIAIRRMARVRNGTDAPVGLIGLSHPGAASERPTGPTHREDCPRRREPFPGRIGLGRPADLTRPGHAGAVPVPTGIPIGRTRTSQDRKRQDSPALVLTFLVPPGTSIVPGPCSSPRSDRQIQRHRRGQQGPTPRAIVRDHCDPDAIRRGRRPDNPPSLHGHGPARFGPVPPTSRTRPTRVRAAPMPTVVPIGLDRTYPEHHRPSSSDGQTTVRVAR